MLRQHTDWGLDTAELQTNLASNLTSWKIFGSPTAVGRELVSKVKGEKDLGEDEALLGSQADGVW